MIACLGGVSLMAFMPPEPPDATPDANVSLHLAAGAARATLMFEGRGLRGPDDISSADL
jgi:hypothetical protein